MEVVAVGIITYLILDESPLIPSIEQVEKQKGEGFFSMFSGVAKKANQELRLHIKVLNRVLNLHGRYLKKVLN